MSKFIFLILVYNIVYSQAIITLNDAIELGLKNSQESKSNYINYENSKKQYSITIKNNLPLFTMDFDLPSYQNNLQSQFNTTTGTQQFFKNESFTMQSRLTLSQPIFFTNGNVSVSGSVFQRQQNATNSEINKDFYSNISFRLSQPLLGYNQQWAELDKSEILFRKEQRIYQKTKKDIIFNLSSAFFGLYQYEKNYEINEERLKQNEEAYLTAQDKYKSGFIAEVEIMQMELDYLSAKNELENMKNSIFMPNNT